MLQFDYNSATLDGVEYSLSDMSSAALGQLRNIQFCDEMIQQLSSEWAISDTARLAYLAAIKHELKQGET